MATVTNNRKVLSVDKKFKVITEIESRKNKADGCWEFGLLNSNVQTVWKTEIKLLVFLNRTDYKLSNYKSLNKVMLTKRCQNCSSNKEIRIYQSIVFVSLSRLKNLQNCLVTKSSCLVLVVLTGLSCIITFPVGKWAVKQGLWTVKLQQIILVSLAQNEQRLPWQWHFQSQWGGTFFQVDLKGHWKLMEKNVLRQGFKRSCHTYSLCQCWQDQEEDIFHDRKIKCKKHASSVQHKQKILENLRFVWSWIVTLWLGTATAKTNSTAHM